MIAFSLLAVSNGEWRAVPLLVAAAILLIITLL